MSRPRDRVCLESGLRLDINRLARRGFIKPGSFTGPVGIWWTDNFGEATATGVITADMSGRIEGWFQILIGDLDQRIILVARPRHFGGRQWFFVCPYLNRRATVLWMPPGAHAFACRQKWERQVAYASLRVGGPKRRADRRWRRDAEPASGGRMGREPAGHLRHRLLVRRDEGGARVAGRLGEAAAADRIEIGIRIGAERDLCCIGKAESTGAVAIHRLFVAGCDTDHPRLIDAIRPRQVPAPQRRRRRNKAQPALIPVAVFQPKTTAR
jgi:hypothetical protein